MAKQKGTYRIKGKHGGLSYYSIKHGVGDVFRTINPQLSERVKTAPEYANTRAYAEEFGVATGASQNIFTTLRECGANITNQTKANKLCSALLSFVHKDGFHPLGQRTLNNLDWQKYTRSYLNTLSKNPIDGVYLPNINIGWRKRSAEGIPYIDYMMSASQAVSDRSILDAKGISQVRVAAYACRVGAKTYVPSIGQYIPSGYDWAEIYNKRIPSTEWELGIFQEKTQTGDRILVDDPNNVTFYLIVVTPYKSSFGGITPIKSLSAFKVLPIPTTPLPPR